MRRPSAESGRKRWVTRGVVGIVLATFFSDVAHEAATAVLPLYLVSVGLGPLALGVIEGAADFLYSLSKLAGGFIGHRVAHKKPIVAAGYALTMLGTGSIAFVRSLHGVATLRSAAWIGRGVRSPLRDFMLADEVETTHYGRAYGMERSADMLGALVGPLLAILLVYVGLSAREVILWTFLPAAIPVVAILLFTRDRGVEKEKPVVKTPGAPIPAEFKRFLGAVLVFGLGDFSRAFLIFLAARALGDDAQSKPATLSIAVLLYALHNGVSALAAYPIGRLGDRLPKMRLLAAGYGVGVLTNVVLAFGSGSIGWLAAAVVLSGIYIAAEETLEKAVGAQMLTRDTRSLGLGILAGANSVGDMVASIGVGLLLEAHLDHIAFGAAAAAGAIGALWMLALARRAAASPDNQSSAGV